MRNAVSRGDAPDYLARGVAAGFAAAMVPIPGLQIVLSILAAWIARGHKAISIFPQFLVNPATMLPLATFQMWLGAKLWPGQSGEVKKAIDILQSGWNNWSWSAPVQSLSSFGSALWDAGPAVLLPLGLGILVTAAAAGMSSYPLSLILFSRYQAARRKASKTHQDMLPPPQPLVLPEIGTGLTRDEAMERFALHPETYVKADAVKLLMDGREAYPEMLHAISTAKESVDLETYILLADHTGRMFAGALIAAALRGVKVRVLYDGVGGMALSEDYLRALLNNGVDVSVFRPWRAFWRFGPGPMNRRDHRKILLVDRYTGFTGGLNIGDDYAAAEDGGEGWRDTHMRVDGKAPAQKLHAMFLLAWRTADKLSADRLRTPPKDGSANKIVVTSDVLRATIPEDSTAHDVAVQILGNKEFLQRFRIRRAYVNAIRRAQRYILIENAYFIPDRGIRRALYRAIRRGVTVAVVVAQTSDVKLAALASRALYGELLGQGVQIFEYPPSMLHSKVAVIDDIWTVVSSYNLDHRSLKHNLEAAVFMIDAKCAKRMREQILKDISICRQITREFNRARPWKEAWMQSVAYSMRYWL